MTVTEFMMIYNAAVMRRDGSVAYNHKDMDYNGTVAHVTLEECEPGSADVWYNCPPRHPGSGEVVAGLFTGWEG